MTKRVLSSAEHRNLYSTLINVSPTMNEFILFMQTATLEDILARQVFFEGFEPNRRNE